MPSRQTKDEREALAERCWRLRHENGLSVTDIADVVGRHRTTVSRLLSQVRRRLAKTYQAGGRFDPSASIAELVDRCERVCALSMQQFTLATEVRDKLRALRTALLADAQKKTVLQDVGLLPRDFGLLRIETQREQVTATEIRRLADELRRLDAVPAENVFNLPLTSRGERAFLDGDVIGSGDGRADDDEDGDDE